MTLTSLWTFSPDPSSPNEWDLVGGLPTITVRPGAVNSWPAVHPGVFDACGGYQGHRISVEFDVSESSATVLALEFAADRGPCPDLEITLDDVHRGLLHPSVQRDDRSKTGEPGPVAGYVQWQVEFPATWLDVGSHVISITTALDAAAALGEDHPGASHDILYSPDEELPAARSHYGRWFGSYLRWSKISLTRSVTIPPATVDVAVRPTPLFVRSGDSDVELVDVDITFPPGTTPPDPIVIEWPTFATVVPPVPHSRDFGMFRARVSAPSFDGPTTVVVREGEHTRSELLTPCRRWNLHLIPHVHLDLGFTDAQGKVLELHCRNIDRALDRIIDDPDFRYCVDGSVIAAEYEKTRPPARVARMHEAIAAGQLGVNAFHSNFLTGLLSLEEIYRSTDFALTLPRSELTGLRYANLTDVPTYSRSIASVLADLGIDAFVGMSNHGRAATDTSDELHLLSPVRWEGPDGRAVLAHFADHYSQLRFLAADPQAVAGATDGLTRYLSRYERDDYLPQDLAVIGTHADNEDLADGDVGFVRRWNDVFAWPRFQVSTFDEYLAAVLPLIDQLPLWRSETGSYWEDGVGSAAGEFATYRRAQALLPAAETLGALVSTASTTVRTNRSELDRAWADLSVAAEHTLTWARGTSHPHAFPVADQLGWKTRYIRDAYRVAIDEMRRHLAQLSEHADLHGPGFLAYNPHAWTADLESELDLAEGIELIGEDGILPVEVISNCSGMRRVRLTLPGMPAHSWRFLPMTAGQLTLPGGEAHPRALEADPVTEEGFEQADRSEPIVTPGWEVHLDPTTQLPTMMRHLRSGRDLVDQNASVQLGQIVRAGEARFSSEDSEQLAHPAAVHRHDRARTLPIENFRYVADPDPSHLVLESPALEYIGRKETYDGIRLRWRGGGAGIAEVTVELLLRDDSDVCDLDVRFIKQPCLDMEAVYVCFPFAGSQPVLRYDRPLGWVCPAFDHGAGASNEWAAVTNTVSLQTEEGEIHWSPLDAPLFTVGDVVRGDWPTTFPQHQGHVYSYVMNNFWPCNTPPWQEGPVSFAYRFGLADDFDAAVSSRFGRTARVGAQVAEILPLDRYGHGDASAYREWNFGLDIKEADVDIQLRQGADPTRSTLRTVNLADRDVHLEITLPPGLRSEDSAQRPGASMALAAFGTQEMNLTDDRSDPSHG